jgi:hypothetical protein
MATKGERGGWKVQIPLATPTAKGHAIFIVESVNNQPLPDPKEWLNIK